MTSNEEDIASKAVVVIIAQSIVDQYPKTMLLDAVFANLNFFNSNDKNVKRKKALLILDEIFKLSMSSI